MVNEIQGMACQKQCVAIQFICSNPNLLCSFQTISVTTMPRPNAIPGLVVPPKSVGVLLPGIEARIVRDDGTDANPNETGELWVKGGNIALGYYSNEKATREAFTTDGWLKTGDHFRTDGKGSFL